MHSRSRNVKALTCSVLVTLSAIIAGCVVSTGYTDIRTDQPGKRLRLVNSLKPCDVMEVNAAEKKLEFVTTLSPSWRDLEAAARVAPHSSVAVIKTNTRKVAHTEDRSEIAQFLESIGLHKDLSRYVVQVDVQSNTTQSYDIRDRAVAHDMINRPYYLSGADDALSAALDKREALFLCTASAEIEDFVVVLHFTRSPSDQQISDVNDQLEKWTRGERGLTKDGSVEFKRLGMGVEIAFKGPMAVRLRINRLKNTPTGRVEVEHGTTIDRARFLNALL